MVKDLREKTGAGMMDCKKALTEAGGDFAKAEEAWVDDLCDAIAANAALLAAGEDASFQNKIHLALEARGVGAHGSTR